MSEKYLGRIDPEEKEWESSPWTALLKERYKLASLFLRNKLVLDSCCGTGFGTINFIVPEAKFTMGFDICESAKNNYGKTQKYEFLVMDGRELKFNSNSFDIVLSLDAIEHFTKEDVPKYLSEMNRVCNKEGLIIGTTPIVIDDNLIPIYLEWNKFHFYMYTKNTLRQTLKRYFSIVEIYEIYSPVFPYFLFLCSQSNDGFSFQNKKILKEYLSCNNKNHEKSKISNYYRWSVMLLKNKVFIKAGYLFFKACLLMLKNIILIDLPCPQGRAS